MLRFLVIPSLVLWCASTAVAQRRVSPDPADHHELLTRRIEKRMDQQQRVMEQMRDLLAETLRKQGDAHVERLRAEIRSQMDSMRADVAEAKAETLRVKEEVRDAKDKLKVVEDQNIVMKQETDRLRAEIQIRSQQQRTMTARIQSLSREVQQLRAAAKKKADDKKPDDGKKKK
ncbi:MAG: hypothetical protein CMJ83_00840 [Planctomycetes bacterium]|nr:hypothetical protein [Planctomycetota bacterium]